MRLASLQPGFCGARAVLDGTFKNGTETGVRRPEKLTRGRYRLR